MMAPQGPVTQPLHHPHCAGVVPSLLCCWSHVLLVLLQLMRFFTRSSQTVRYNDHSSYRAHGLSAP